MLQNTNSTTKNHVANNIKNNDDNTISSTENEWIILNRPKKLLIKHLKCSSPPTTSNRCSIVHNDTMRDNNICVTNETH